MPGKKVFCFIFTLVLIFGHKRKLHVFKANDFEKARQADKAAKDKAEAEYRAQLRAMLAEEYHERMEFILEIDNVYKTISAS